MAVYFSGWPSSSHSTSSCVSSFAHVNVHNSTTLNRRRETTIWSDARKNLWRSATQATHRRRKRTPVPLQTPLHPLKTHNANYIHSFSLLGLRGYHDALARFMLYPYSPFHFPRLEDVTSSGNPSCHSRSYLENMHTLSFSFPLFRGQEDQLPKECTLPV